MDADDEVEFLSHSSVSKENTDCEEDHSVKWCELPAIAVEKIYSFLERKDQSSMSQVCKNWCREYSSPNLWRSIKFCLPEQAYTKDMRLEVRFAQRFGHFFHHILLIFDRIPFEMLEINLRQLKLFLKSLEEHSQLLSISFIGMVEILMLLEEEIYNEICQCLIRLLLKQRKLRTVNFTHSEFSRKQGIEILEAIFSKNSVTLKNIKLLGFFVDDKIEEDDWEDTPINVPVTFEALMNLKTLMVDYTPYFANTITSCYEYGSGLHLKRTGCLESIFLFVRRYDSSRSLSRMDRIQPAVWKYFRKVSPALKLNVQVCLGGRMRLDVSPVHDMPVRHLDIRCHAENYELGTIFRHLQAREMNGNLELLNISYFDYTTQLAQDLLDLLQVSPKLKKLQLQLFEMEVNDFRTVFEYWIENGPKSLETVHIVIRLVLDKATALNYINLADKYAPLLQNVGLNLILTVEDSWEVK